MAKRKKIKRRLPRQLTKSAHHQEDDAGLAGLDATTIKALHEVPYEVRTGALSALRSALAETEARRAELYSELHALIERDRAAWGIFVQTLRDLRKPQEAAPEAAESEKK